MGLILLFIQRACIQMSLDVRYIPGFPGYFAGEDGSIWSTWSTGDNRFTKWRIRERKPYKETSRGSNRIDNLKYGTPSENASQVVEEDRCGRAKLKNWQAREIKQELGRGVDAGDCDGVVDQRQRIDQ